MDEWISVKDSLPKDGQRIVAKGTAVSRVEVILELTYFESVGLISNITHWKNNE